MLQCFAKSALRSAEVVLQHALLGHRQQKNWTSYRGLNGYSIENDAYRDVDCERLLSAAEKQSLYDEVRVFCYWYALAVSRGGMELGTHPNRLLDDSSERARMTEMSPAESYSQELYDAIVGDCAKLIRGKS